MDNATRRQTVCLSLLCMSFLSWPYLEITFQRQVKSTVQSGRKIWAKFESDTTGLWCPLKKTKAVTPSFNASYVGFFSNARYSLKRMKHKIKHLVAYKQYFS